MVIPENAILKLTPEEITKFIAENNREPGTMEILKPFFSDSIIYILMLAFFIPGLAYGIAAKTVKSHKDVINSMTKAMASCGPGVSMFM